MPSIFVEDGYTLTGEWPAASDGRYPGGKFVYRRALGDQRDKYRGSPWSQMATVRAEILEKYVESVTPDDPGATPLKLTAEQWKKARPDIAETILNYVLDYVGAEQAEKNSGTASG